MKNLIIRLNTSNSPHQSLEGVKINKIVSSISPSNFIKLLRYADNKVNPRIATVNKITKSIHETLKSSPELFWLKSKGILLATESCKILDRNRVQVTLDNVDFEGIMDGGHNTFAIATYLIEELFDEKMKTWDDCKEYWRANYAAIESEFLTQKDRFEFSIPIEIIMPNDEDGALEEYYDHIAEICSARNNNVQLRETAKGNQVGFYDYLKKRLDDFDIIWKTGDKGKIKSEDVISLATIPLIFLKNQGLLPDDIKALNKISVYSQKGKCIDFFNEVMNHDLISDENNGKHILKDEYVKSALSLTEDILRFFDRMFISFPDLYHEASPGKFGRISIVNHNKETKVPFYTTEETSKYQYPFGFFYPLITGLTALMEVDKSKKIVRWKYNPTELDMLDLDLTQYVNIIKLVNFDPQKIGKSDSFYKEAENTFEKLVALF